jgi:hypothetical protein
MNEEFEKEEVRKSKYNSGIAKEMRRNDLWKDSNSHSRSGQYKKWNEDLDRIWCELSSDVHKKNLFEVKEKLFKQFDIDLAQLGEFDNKGNVGFEKPSEDKMNNRSLQYRKLMEKEIFLRLLEEEVGKGTSWEEDDEDEF